jgi:hypothetical protein
MGRCTVERALSHYTLRWAGIQWDEPCLMIPCDGPITNARSPFVLEALRWADIVCREFHQIRNLAMGRIGLQEVLSD